VTKVKEDFEIERTSLEVDYREKIETMSSKNKKDQKAQVDKAKAE
jgi:hypothetical protein